MKKIFFSTLILLLLAAHAPMVFAGDVTSVQPNKSSYVLLEPLPKIAGVSDNAKCLDKNGLPMKDKNGEAITNDGDFLRCIQINTYIEYVFKFAIGIAVFLATVMIIYGGFQWMLSDIPFIKVNGKEKIEHAVFGLVAALASYLILQTIDPRLVQVNTSITPIVLPTPDAAQFVSQLQSDLNKVSTEVRAQVVEQQKNINELQAKKNELEAKLFTQPGVPNPDDTPENRVALEKTNNDLNVALGGQSKLIANGSMARYFNDAEGFIDGGGGTSQAVKNSIDSINSVYDSTIKSGALDSQPDAKEALKFQRDFRINQLKDDQNLNVQIESYKQGKADAVVVDEYGRSSTDGINTNDIKIDLKSSRNVYQTELDFLSDQDAQASSYIKNRPVLNLEMTRAKMDPVISKEYQVVLQRRIEKIDSVLSPASKSPTK
jgi:hypothetical protein